ncbi:hypothetical protein [Streptomyces sp. LN704]|uniref:hypothetical protein n=1 Tax=unclassified Streptomyces TaxID=2593676 RepID=UPI0037247C9C
MSGPHDFDFLHGDWNVHHRRLADFLDEGSDWEEGRAGAVRVVGDLRDHGPLGTGLLGRRGENPGDELGHGVHPAGGFLNARSVNRGSGRGTS